VTEDELSIPQIAKRANVTEKTVRDWMDAGKLPVSQTIKQGAQRRRYATKAAVDQWLETLAQGEPTTEATSRPTNTPKLASC
jgi:excisionase family DNA binding protein